MAWHHLSGVGGQAYMYRTKMCTLNSCVQV